MECTVRNPEGEVGRMKKLNFYFPPALVERLEKMATGNSVNASQIVRKAVEEFITKLEREEIEKEIVKASKANREFDQKFAAAWSRFETRNE